MAHFSVGANSMGYAAQAQEWVAELRQHRAFCSVEAVRATFEPTFDPACIGQLERLLDTLSDAGLSPR